jgi:hypothetical protein
MAESTWCQLHSGTQFDLDTFSDDDLHVKDIARSLSMQCRYNGHLTRFYSVAEHCVLMTRFALHQKFCTFEEALEVLLHDAAEAYLCDIPRPFKRHLSNYAELEQRIEVAIARKFNLEYPHSELVKELDTRILFDEKLQLMDAQIDWGWSAIPLGVECVGWTPEVAERYFLETYHGLTGQLA